METTIFTTVSITIVIIAYLISRGLNKPEQISKY